MAVSEAMIAIAVAPRKTLSTGVAAISAQRRNRGYPLTATTSQRVPWWLERRAEV